MIDTAIVKARSGYIFLNSGFIAPSQPPSDHRNGPKSVTKPIEKNVSKNIQRYARQFTRNHSLMIPVLVFGRGETRQQASQTIGGAKRRRTKASVDFRICVQVSSSNCDRAKSPATKETAPPQAIRGQATLARCPAVLGTIADAAYGFVESMSIPFVLLWFSFAVDDLLHLPKLYSVYAG